MARKKKYQHDESDYNQNDNDFFVSRSQKKRDSANLQQIGEEIALLPKNALEKLPLSEDLKNAFNEYKQISQKEAKRRHLQYIGRLMRENKSQTEVDNSDDLINTYLEMKKYL